MSEQVDELFGEGADRAAPRTALTMALLLGGLLTAVLGLACTTVPGGLAVLGAFLVVEGDLDRVESGYLPASDEPAVRRVRVLVMVAVALVILLFVVQMTLLSIGVYDGFVTAVLDGLVGRKSIRI